MTFRFLQVLQPARDLVWPFLPFLAGTSREAEGGAGPSGAGLEALERRIREPGELGVEFREWGSGNCVMVSS